MSKLRNFPKNSLINLIRFYQKHIGKLFPHKCSFYPCCSEYFVEAVQIFGFLKGLNLGLCRIVRCNPANRGRVDMVPFNIKGDFRWFL